MMKRAGELREISFNLQSAFPERSIFERMAGRIGKER
jgi:hypothetical protein